MKNAPSVTTSSNLESANMERRAQHAEDAGDLDRAKYLRALDHVRLEHWAGTFRDPTDDTVAILERIKLAENRLEAAADQLRVSQRRKLIPLRRWT